MRESTTHGDSEGRPNTMVLLEDNKALLSDGKIIPNSIDEGCDVIRFYTMVIIVSMELFLFLVTHKGFIS